MFSRADSRPSSSPSSGAPTAEIAMAPASSDPLTPFTYNDYNQEQQARRTSMTLDVGSRQLNVNLDDDDEGNDDRFIPMGEPLKPAAHFEPPIPFGLSRWVILGMVVYIAVVTGPHVFNWTPWETILKEQGIFSDLCAGEPDPSVACAAQSARIASILSIVTLCMFSMTFVSGFLLDLAGPRVCSVLGGALLMLGYMMLMFYRKSSNMVMVGFAFVGAGFDPTFFGLLCVANLFPGHGAAVIACLGGCRSVSTVLPVIFKPLVSDSFDLTKVGVVLLVLTGVALALIAVVSPRVAYRHVVVFPPDSAIFPEPAPDFSRLTSLALAQTGAATPHVVRHQATKIQVKGGGLRQAVSGYALDKWGKLCSQVRETIVLLPDPMYWLVVIVSIVNMIRNNWFLSSATQQFSQGAVNYLTILNTVSFVVGPIMGVIVDLWGPIVVMFLLGVTNVATIVFMLFTQVGTNKKAVEALSFLSCTFALPGIGFLLSQIYCYMAVVFPPEHMGKLVGFAAFCSGLAALVVDPLYSWAQSNNFWTIDMAIAIATVATTVVVALLFPLHKRRDARKEKETWHVQEDY